MKLLGGTPILVLAFNHDLVSKEGWLSRKRLCKVKSFSLFSAIQSFDCWKGHVMWFVHDSLSIRTIYIVHLAWRWRGERRRITSGWVWGFQLVLGAFCSDELRRVRPYLWIRGRPPETRIGLATRAIRPMWCWTTKPRLSFSSHYERAWNISVN